MSAWIIIERQYDERDLAIGPYPSEAEAMHAMENALLIDGFCEEDCLECYVADSGFTPSAGREDYEVVSVDLTDPHHTGK